MLRAYSVEYLSRSIPRSPNLTPTTIFHEMLRLNTLCNVLIIAFLANGQIFYPNAGSVSDFHVGDTLTVELLSYDVPSRLSLFCSNEARRK